MQLSFSVTYWKNLFFAFQRFATRDCPNAKNMHAYNQCDWDLKPLNTVFWVAIHTPLSPSQIASWLQCFTLQLWVWWRTDTCEIDFVCNPFTSLIQKYIFTEQSLYLSAVSSTNGYQSRRPNSITTNHFKFIVSSYKFSDFTTLDIRVEGLLRYISMSQLANSELKQTYSTVGSDQGARSGSRVCLISCVSA